MSDLALNIKSRKVDIGCGFENESIPPCCDVLQRLALWKIVLYIDLTMVRSCYNNSCYIRDYIDITCSNLFCVLCHETGFAEKPDSSERYVWGTVLSKCNHRFRVPVTCVCHIWTGYDESNA